MRVFAVIAALAIVAAVASSANAQTRREPRSVVIRSAAGTVIQPTRTIIHDRNGNTTVIVVPRRSYLDTGTEVSPGDRKFQEYMFPTGGDPGRQNWFFGPDFQGKGQYPLPGPAGMNVSGSLTPW